MPASSFQHPQSLGAEFKITGARYQIGDGHYRNPHSGRKYLFACVLDLLSKPIAGWSMHHRKYRQMAMKAVKVAVLQRQGEVPVILHSDRGSQLTCGDHQCYLSNNRLVSSMSAVGHCSDNTDCKGVFRLLKRERMHDRLYRTHTKQGLIYSTTLSGSIILECDVELLLRIESFQQFYNRPWKRDKTHDWVVSISPATTAPIRPECHHQPTPKALPDYQHDHASACGQPLRCSVIPGLVSA
jgi:transposase InsO family protein